MVINKCLAFLFFLALPVPVLAAHSARPSLGGCQSSVGESTAYLPGLRHAAADIHRTTRGCRLRHAAGGRRARASGRRGLARPQAIAGAALER